MANYRIITGQFNNFLTDTPYKYGQVNIRLKQNTYTIAAGFPAYNKTIGLDATGALPVGLELWCNGDGLIAAEYEVTEPDATKFSFTLNYDDGTPISLQALRAGGAVPSNPGTVNSLIAAEIAAKAVRFDIAQSLTDEQKTQARNNIGAGTGGGGGGGETNTASNVGTAGIGFFKQKAGVNLEFKKLNAASNKISITDDTANSKVDINVNEANFSGIPQSAVTNLTTALTARELTTNKNIANGYAGLDGNGFLDPSRIPALKSHEFLVVANQAARLALTTAQVQLGDEAFQTDSGETYKLISADPSQSGSWQTVADTTPDWAAIQNKPDFSVYATKTGAENLTNKTITSPILNLTSDATGDIYYRNSGGNLARLPIGTNGQVFTVTSGLPSWATPSGGGGASSPLTLTANNANETPLTLSLAVSQAVAALLVKNSGGATIGGFSEMGGVYVGATSAHLYYDSGFHFQLNSQNAMRLDTNFYLKLRSDGHFGWSSTTSLSPFLDTAFRRASAGRVAVTGGWNGSTYDNTDGSMEMATLYLKDGTVKQVTYGANDSGGSGFKVLRIAN